MGSVAFRYFIAAKDAGLAVCEPYVEDLLLTASKETITAPSMPELIRVPGVAGKLLTPKVEKEWDDPAVRSTEGKPYPELKSANQEWPSSGLGLAARRADLGDGSSLRRAPSSPSAAMNHRECALEQPSAGPSLPKSESNCLAESSPLLHSLSGQIFAAERPSPTKHSRVDVGRSSAGRAAEISGELHSAEQHCTRVGREQQVCQESGSGVVRNKGTHLESDRRVPGVTNWFGGMGAAHPVDVARVKPDESQNPERKPGDEAGANGTRNQNSTVRSASEGSESSISDVENKQNKPHHLSKRRRMQFTTENRAAGEPSPLARRSPAFEEAEPVRNDEVQNNGEVLNGGPLAPAGEGPRAADIHLDTEREYMEAERRAVEAALKAENARLRRDEAWRYAEQKLQQAQDALALALRLREEEKVDMDDSMRGGEGRPRFEGYGDADRRHSAEYVSASSSFGEGNDRTPDASSGGGSAREEVGDWASGHSDRCCDRVVQTGPCPPEKLDKGFEEQGHKEGAARTRGLEWCTWRARSSVENRRWVLNTGVELSAALNTMDNAGVKGAQISRPGASPQCFSVGFRDTKVAA